MASAAEMQQPASVGRDMANSTNEDVVTTTKQALELPPNSPVATTGNLLINLLLKTIIILLVKGIICFLLFWFWSLLDGNPFEQIDTAHDLI